MRGFIARKRDEGGFALALLAVSLVALIAVAGLAIDVGSWYLRVNQMQRAADAASLAGAAKMPDVNAANAAALEAAQRNGFVNGGKIKLEFTPILPDKYQTRVVDSNPPIYFSGMFIQGLSLDRTSFAQFADSVPMGSPFNFLGMGDVVPTSALVPVQNFWLAVNGYCLPKEDGDLLLAGYDGTVKTNADGSFAGVGSSDGLACGSKMSGAEANTDYDKNGYSYSVEVPPGAGSAQILIYDGAFSNHTADPPAAGIRPAGGRSPDGAKAPVGQAASTIQVTTTFRLWDTLNDSTDENDRPVPGAPDVTFVTNDARGVDKYYVLGTVPAATGVAHRYRVQVFTQAGEANSLGVNAFGISAKTLGGDCDSRLKATCPRVYGQNAISLYANLNPGNLAAGTSYNVELYLAQINGNFAGKTFEVNLWDPGENGRSISLINPSNTAARFDYNAIKAPSKKASGNNVTSINTSDSNIAPPGPNRSNRWQYNDRLVSMRSVLPTSYLTDYGDEWWKLRYRLTVPATGSVTERATWSARVENGDPVHLIRDPNS